MNMALDDALLRAAPERGRPLLRFYGWNASAVSIGFFQMFSPDLAPGRPVVRRPTGGGFVDHARDMTYTVVVPAGHALWRVATTESYRRIHEAVAAALRRAGWVAELAPCCGAATPGVCFAGPVQFDVVVAGQKVAGAAQRRLKRGLLHQGSILLPTAESGSRCPTLLSLKTEVGQTGMSASRSTSVIALNGELKRGFEEALGVRFENWRPGPEVFDLARSLCAEKYGARAWTERFRA
jgi:lipoate-protein ligase A